MAKVKKKKKILTKPAKSRKIFDKKKIAKNKKTKLTHVNLKKIVKTKEKIKAKKSPSSLRAKAKQSQTRKTGLPRRLKAPRNDKKLVSEFPAESLFKARIKVIGIGGGGGSIVSEIGRSLEKANFVVADTDMRALKKKSGIKYFLFGQEQTHGLGTGVNVELAKQAAEGAKEKISSLFKEQDIIIFIASLGGGLGSGATQVFAEAAREFGGITFGIFTMPFKFEGKNKLRIAQNSLKTLRQSLNVSLVIPNEKIFKIIDANTAITDAFSIVNKSLIESLESLIDLIYNPGIINIDFADLRTILKGRGNTAFLNTIEESGKNRAESICEKVLTNPLLQNNSFEAEKILFNIAGSENLSMFEVEKISSHITGQNSKAKIIFGISKSAKLKNKIKTTILMTGGGKEVDLEEIGEEAEKKEEVAEKEPEEIKKEIIKEVKKKKEKIKPKKKSPKKHLEKKKKEPEKEKPQASEPSVYIPVFQTPVSPAVMAQERRLSIIEAESELAKKGLRRSGLEIRKAEELQEKKKIEQEKEWEIPAFLRKVKYKS